MNPTASEIEGAIDKLIEIRDLHHITRQTVAQALGVAETTIYKWETGTHYPSNMAAKHLIRYVKKF